MFFSTNTAINLINTHRLLLFATKKMSRPKGHTPGMDPNAHRFFDGFPCSEAMEASYKCLTENNFDHSKCEDYFSAYKECKKRWLQEKRKHKKLELFGSTE